MNPENEQEVCITCGFCCDGTLFLHACLNTGERGNLPEKIEESSFTEEGKDYFHLPCNYFSEKCIIYDKNRAQVCSSFRCQLLKDLATGKLTNGEALSIVSEAKHMRRELMELFGTISDKGNGVNFREILLQLGNFRKKETEGETVSPDYEILVARCNIFEALLIKYFRSTDDFEKMMIQIPDSGEVE